MSDQMKEASFIMSIMDTYLIYYINSVITGLSSDAVIMPQCDLT